MNELESTLYALTRLFMTPVLLLIVAALIYAFVSLGAFTVEAWQRRRGQYRSPLHQYRHKASDDLELWIMQRLEWLRITSRSAPMLGLVATMIPMGPALLALTRSDAQAVGVADEGGNALLSHRGCSVARALAKAKCWTSCRAPADSATPREGSPGGPQPP